jgi:hypothetical protein
MQVTRRTIARLIAGAPVAAAALPVGSLLGARPAAAAEAAAEASATPAPPEETPLGRFLAREDESLSADERRRVRKQIASLEQGLKEVRDFQLSNEVPPAGTFKALRPARKGGRR